MEYKFDKLQEKLEEELKDFPELITEDLIRQWYIQIKGKLHARIEIPYLKRKNSDAISLEANRLFNSQRCRADLYFKNDDCVVEFKYHKRLKTSTTCKTNNWGYVFGDMNRLSTLNNEHKLLIYVFDNEMRDYYDNKCRELLRESGESFNSMTVLKRCDTKSFTEPALGLFNNRDINKFSYEVNIVYSYNFANGFYLRVYEIQK